MSSFKIVYRLHAVQRMFERSITESELSIAVTNGKTIEQYPQDRPYPSRLLVGTVKGRSLHVVIADAKDRGEIIIITVYEPDLERWEIGFETRRK